MNVVFKEITDGESLQLLSEISALIWREYYPELIGSEQVEYMVDKFLSVPAMKKQIDEGYRFFFVQGGEEVLGYIGVQPRGEELFLSKLYLRKEYRGKGVFSGMLAFCENLASELSLTSLSLTVNRGNTQSINVYLRKGFRILREQKSDIGNGYFMDDFVMQKSPLTSKPELM